jgi:hypothetical protein
MTLLGRKRQLERADLITQIEQGRRVEQELFQENTRGIRTMGELLKARVFGSTQWAIDLRNRLTKFQGGGNSASAAAEDRGVSVGPGRSPEPHPDLDAEEGA